MLMDIGAIFFILALVTLVGMYVGQPYIQRYGRRATQEDHEYSALMAEYDRAVNTLQELDFDHALGKVPEADYPRQRAELLAIGSGLLRKLDSLTLPPSSSTTSGARSNGRGEQSSSDAESRIEAAVASRRADSSATRATAVLDDEALESMIASHRKTHKEKSAGFCPICGKPILVSDRFCPSCGKAID
jgi:rubrerythrin